MKKKQIKKFLYRIGAFLASILFAFITPWWFLFGFIAYMTLVFGRFYEGIFAAFLIDAFYSDPNQVWFLRLRFTILALFISWLLAVLRSRISFYSTDNS